MSTSRALASYVTCATDQHFRGDHLKLCVLWYDEVIFETLGRFDQDRFFELLLGNENDARKTIKTLTDFIVPLDRRIGPDAIREVAETHHPGYPRWGDHHENYTYPEPETAAEYAHNALLGRIASEQGVSRFSDGYAIEQAEGRARVAVDAVRLWERVNQDLPCMLQAGMDEKLAMTAAQQFTARAAQAPAPVHLFEMAIPSLNAVPWHRIVELWRSGAIDSLRAKVGSALAQAGSNLEAAKKVLDEVERHAMDAIIERTRPRPLKVAIEAILANIPGLLVNPFSLYFGGRDTVSATKRSKEHGWLYLLRDIRDMGGTKPEATQV